MKILSQMFFMKRIRFPKSKVKIVQNIYKELLEKPILTEIAVF